MVSLKYSTDAYGNDILTPIVDPAPPKQEIQYKVLQPHQQRVVDEKADLDEKRKKLKDFTGTSVFHGLPEAEKVRLVQQDTFMNGYSRILSERIAAF